MNQKSTLKSFPSTYWIVIMFEFFERGAYYGMMSFLSVYLTENLHFAKQSVGLIKGTIQPLLYFLPIVSGAVADRFGYRRTLMIAFSLLGGGYLLTSQMTSYSAVFLALIVMGLGAGTFKPIISGSIARTTDKSNSTLGFGIYYWSINLGAFLFPLILVPWLKNNPVFGPKWVIIASALCTGAMIIPTLFLYKEPPKHKIEKEKPNDLNLIKTIANGFEIIYSPFILIYHYFRSSRNRSFLIYGIIALLLFLSVWQYITLKPFTETVDEAAILENNTALIFTIERDVMKKNPFQLNSFNDQSINSLKRDCILVTISKPDEFQKYRTSLLSKLQAFPALENLSLESITILMNKAQQKSLFTIKFEDQNNFDKSYSIEKDVADDITLTIYQPGEYNNYKHDLLEELNNVPNLITLSQSKLDELVDKAQQRSFFFLYIILLFISSLIILRVQNHYIQSDRLKKTIYNLISFAGIVVIIFVVPGLSLFSKIVSTIIYFTVLSLFIIEIDDKSKFKDNFRFLLMICIYSGFWILYFQMFDSVLWYVKAYVDATSLNNFVNSILHGIGLNINWFFDVEGVTYINAGTIILLQLLVSNIVKNTKALPTMVVGIAMGTVGMAILAISTDIWVFMAGIIIFSIGEMTAHPKFVSYVGLTAPKDRVATYMGYIFLYGVIGSSIGAILGANMYVHFVDKLNQPRTLWLIFSGIGIVTIVALLLYNKFVKTARE